MGLVVRASGDAARRTRLRLVSDCLLAVLLVAALAIGTLRQGEMFYLVLLGLLLIGVIADIARVRTAPRSAVTEQDEPAAADLTG